MLQFVSYAAAGALSTLVHYATLLALLSAVHVGSAAGIAALSTVGALAGAITSYVLNYRWTFASRAPHARASLRFFAVAGLCLAVNASVVAVLVAATGSILVAQLTATVAVLGLGYILNREWTFR